MSAQKGPNAQPKKLPPHLTLTAGAIAGVSEILICYPLDVVKTRNQLSTTKSTGLMSMFAQIVRSEGFGALYRGILPPIFVEAPKRAIKFGANEEYGKLFKTLGLGGNAQLLAIMTGMAAGATESLVVISPDMVKIRLQDKSNAGRYKSTADAFKKIYAEEGFTAFWKGTEATMLRHIVWNAGYFGVIQAVRQRLPKAETSNGVLLNNFLAGAIGGTAGTILNTPFDVVKSRVQGQILPPFKYNWAFPAIAKIAREEGVGALYKGFVPKVLRLGPGGGILLLVFDAVTTFMQNFGEPSGETSSGPTMRTFDLPQLPTALLDSIDVILLSNSFNILGLPYVTEYSGFKGRVFASEPTTAFGSSCAVRYFNGSITKPYTVNDIKSCLSKITAVRFHEVIRVYHGLEVFPISSGYGLGASNWIINYQFQKVLYLSASASVKHGSKHSAAIDPSALSGFDIVIASEVSPVELTFDKCVNQIFMQVLRFIEQGKGNLVFPVQNYGIVFDLLELVHHALDTLGKAGTLIHFVSPVAKESLLLCNILGEWMNLERQTNVFSSKIPMNHTAWMENNKLIPHEHFNTLFEHPSPYIVFVGHPTLAFGEVGYFLEKWRADQHTTVIMTDETVTYADLWKGFPQSRVSHYPIESRLTLAELTEIVVEIRPQWLVSSNRSTTRNNLKGLAEKLKDVCSCSWLGPGESIGMPLQSPVTLIKLTKEVAIGSRIQKGDGKDYYKICGRLRLPSCVDDNVVLEPIDFESRFSSKGFLTRLSRALIDELAGVCVSYDASTKVAVVKVDDCEVSLAPGHVSVEGRRSETVDELMRWIDEFL